MLMTCYYLIRPSPQLLRRLQQEGEDAVALLGEASLWEKVETGNPSIPFSDWLLLRVAQVKLLFMLNLKADYLDDGHSEGDRSRFAYFLGELLGLPTLRVETFDRWWSVERIDSLGAKYEQVESSFTAEQLACLEVPQISSADLWLDALRKQPKVN